MAAQHQHQHQQQTAASGRATPSTTTNQQRAAHEQVAMTRFDRDFHRIFGEPKK